jgi:glycosyltransferase involved in cell wall biosynthesis
MRSVLFIAYYYPPIASSGVYRSAKFVKYLPQFGWQPYVVSTTEDIGVGGFDASLLDDIPPDTPVWRLPTPQPRPYAALARLLRRSQAEGSAAQRESNPVSGQCSIPSQTNTAHPGRDSGLNSVLKTLARPLRFIQNPPVDPQWYWSLRLIPLACRVMRRHDVAAIYTSSAPWSALLSALVLKRLTGRPWIMDMRDPWTSDECLYRSRGLRREIDLRLERAALRAADRIVVTSPAFVDELQEVSEDCVASKVTVITNGYDEEDFSPESGADLLPSDRRTIAHMGTLIWERAQPLLAALSELASDRDVLDKFRVISHGWTDPRIAARAANQLATGCFVTRPMIGHDRALAIMKEADVLLLLLGAQEHWSRFYTGKVFEYLRAGKPVLGVGPWGVASKLIERCGVGCFVPAHDAERLATVLRQIALDYRSFVDEHYHPEPEIIAQYDRRVLTERLASVLDSEAAK